jgi:hypothetical protein
MGRGDMFVALNTLDVIIMGRGDLGVLQAW